MPNLTAPLPRRTGDLQEDFNELYRCYIALVDDMKNLLCNLDSGNVTEAASVKVQNLDATQAKIKDAQIASLTADKLTAGTIDAGLITVKGENDDGSMTLTGESLEFRDKDNKVRVFIGNIDGKVYFTLQNADGTQKVEMDDTGKICLTGNIETTQDCVVQGQLRVGLRDSDVNKGIAFYGKQYKHNGKNNSYCGGIFPYVYAFTSGVPTYDGICIDSSLYLCKNDTYSKAVTENELSSAVRELQRQINALGNE